MKNPSPSSPSTSPPTFQRLSDWLREISRSYGWYRDALVNPQSWPRPPPLIKQGRNNFIRYADGQAYKRELLKSAGVAVPGRPRKPTPEQSIA
jgi:hypothetical protein